MFFSPPSKGAPKKEVESSDTQNPPTSPARVIFRFQTRMMASPRVGVTTESGGGQADGRTGGREDWKEPVSGLPSSVLTGPVSGLPSPVLTSPVSGLQSSVLTSPVSGLPSPVLTNPVSGLQSPVLTNPVSGLPSPVLTGPVSAKQLPRGRRQAPFRLAHCVEFSNGWRTCASSAPFRRPVR